MEEAPLAPAPFLRRLEVLRSRKPPALFLFLAWRIGLTKLRDNSSGAPASNFGSNIHTLLWQGYQVGWEITSSGGTRSKGKGIWEQLQAIWDKFQYQLFETAVVLSVLHI